MAAATKQNKRDNTLGTIERLLRDQTDATNRQWEVAIFLEYTRRYLELTKEAPDVWRQGLHRPVDKHQQKKPEFQLTCLRYLNMCSEEFHLYHQGYLTEAVWNVWEPMVLRTLNTAHFREFWRAHCDEFESFPKFQEWVEDSVKKE